MAVHSHLFKKDRAEDPRHGHEHHHGQHNEQAHGHQHAHDHHHGHGHGKEDSNKFMTGDRYWRWPGLRETALKTSSSVVNALAELGISKEEMAKLDVIEVGCGGGAVTRLLAPTFGSITAIDIESTMIASLHSRLSPSLFASSGGNTTALVHTITSSSPSAFSTGELQSSPTDSDAERQVKPPQAQFDVAVIINVLHHIENPNDFFPGLQGLMKKGGKVVVIEPNGLGMVPPTGQHVKLRPDEGIEELSEADLEAMKSHGHNHSHFFTTDKLSEAFTARGFKVLLAKEDGTMPTQGVGRDEMRVGVVVAEA